MAMAGSNSCGDSIGSGNAAATPSTAGLTTGPSPAAEKLFAECCDAAAIVHPERHLVPVRGVFFIALGTWGDVFPLFCAAVRTLEIACRHTPGPLCPFSADRRNVDKTLGLEVFFVTHACWANVLLLSVRSCTSGLAVNPFLQTCPENLCSGVKTGNSNKQACGENTHSREEDGRGHTHGKKGRGMAAAEAEERFYEKRHWGTGARRLHEKTPEKKTDRWKSRSARMCAQRRRGSTVRGFLPLFDAAHHRGEDAGARVPVRCAPCAQQCVLALGPSPLRVGRLSFQQACSRVQQLQHSVGSAAGWRYSHSENPFDQRTAAARKQPPVSRYIEAVCAADATADSRPPAAGTPPGLRSSAVQYLPDPPPSTVDECSAADARTASCTSPSKASSCAGSVAYEGPCAFAPSVFACSCCHEAGGPLSAAATAGGASSVSAAVSVNAPFASFCGAEAHADSQSPSHPTVVSAGFLPHAESRSLTSSMYSSALLPSNAASSLCIAAKSSFVSARCCLWIIPIRSSPLLESPAAQSATQPTSLPCRAEEIKPLVRLLLACQRYSMTTCIPECSQRLHCVTHAYGNIPEHEQTNAADKDHGRTSILTTPATINDSVNVRAKRSGPPTSKNSRGWCGCVSCAGEVRNICTLCNTCSGLSMAFSCSRCHSKPRYSSACSGTSRTSTDKAHFRSRGTSAYRSKKRTAEDAFSAKSTSRTCVSHSGSSCYFNIIMNNHVSCRYLRHGRKSPFGAVKDSSSSVLARHSTDTRRFAVNRDGSTDGNKCQCLNSRSRSSAEGCSSGIFKNSRAGSSIKEMSSGFRWHRRDSGFESCGGHGGFLARYGESVTKPRMIRGNVEQQPLLERSPAFVCVCNPFSAVWMHAAEAAGMARLLLVPSPAVAMRQPPSGLVEAIVARCPHLQKQASSLALLQHGYRSYSMQGSLTQQSCTPKVGVSSFRRSGQGTCIDMEILNTPLPHGSIQPIRGIRYAGYTRLAAGDRQAALDELLCSHQQRCASSTLSSQGSRNILGGAHVETAAPVASNDGDCRANGTDTDASIFKVGPPTTAKIRCTLTAADAADDTNVTQEDDITSNARYEAAVAADVARWAVRTASRPVGLDDISHIASTFFKQAAVKDDMLIRGQVTGDTCTRASFVYIPRASDLVLVRATHREVLSERRKHWHWRLFLEDHDVFRESVLRLGPLLRSTCEADLAANEAAAAGEPSTAGKAIAAGVATEAGDRAVGNDTARAGEALTAGDKAAGRTSAGGKGILPGEGAARDDIEEHESRAAAKLTLGVQSTSSTHNVDGSARSKNNIHREYRLGNEDGSFALSCSSCMLCEISRAVDSTMNQVRSERGIRGTSSFSPSSSSSSRSRRSLFFTSTAAQPPCVSQSLGEIDEAGLPTHGDNRDNAGSAKESATAYPVDRDSEPRAIPVIHMFDADNLFPEAAARLPASAVVARPPSAPWTSLQALLNPTVAEETEVTIRRPPIMTPMRDSVRSEANERLTEKKVPGHYQSDEEAYAAESVDSQHAFATARPLQQLQLQYRGQREQQKYQREQPEGHQQHKYAEGTALTPSLSNHYRSQQGEQTAKSLSTMKGGSGMHCDSFVAEALSKQQQRRASGGPPKAQRSALAARVSFYDDVGRPCFTVKLPYQCCARPQACASGKIGVPCGLWEPQHTAEAASPAFNAGRSDPNAEQLSGVQVLSHAELSLMLREAGAAARNSRKGDGLCRCPREESVAKGSVSQPGQNPRTAADRNVCATQCDEAYANVGGELEAPTSTKDGDSPHTNTRTKLFHADESDSCYALLSGHKPNDTAGPGQRMAISNPCGGDLQIEKAPQSVPGAKKDSCSEIRLSAVAKTLLRAAEARTTVGKTFSDCDARAKATEKEDGAADGSTLHKMTVREISTVVGMSTQKKLSKHAATSAEGTSTHAKDLHDGSCDMWYVADTGSSCKRLARQHPQPAVCALVAKQHSPQPAEGAVLAVQCSQRVDRALLAKKQGQPPDHAQHRTVDRAHYGEEGVQAEVKQATFGGENHPGSGEAASEALNRSQERDHTQVKMTTGGHTMPGWLLYVAYGSMHARELGLLPSVALLAKVFASVGVALSKRVLLHVPFPSFDAAVSVQQSHAPEGSAADDTDRSRFGRPLYNVGENLLSAGSFSFPWRVLVLHSVVEIPALLCSSETDTGERQNITGAEEDVDSPSRESRSLSTCSIAEAAALDSSTALQNAAAHLNASITAVSTGHNYTKHEAGEEEAHEEADKEKGDTTAKKCAGSAANDRLKSEGAAETPTKKKGVRETRLRSFAGGDKLKTTQDRRTNKIAEENTSEHLSNSPRARSKLHMDTAKRREETPTKGRTDGDAGTKSTYRTEGGLLKQLVLIEKGKKRISQRPKEGQRLFCILTHASAGAAATFFPMAAARLPVRVCCHKLACYTNTPLYKTLDSKHINGLPGVPHVRLTTAEASCTDASSGSNNYAGPISRTAGQRAQEAASKASEMGSLCSQCAAPSDAETARSPYTASDPLVAFSVRPSLSHPAACRQSERPRHPLGVPWLVLPFFYDQPMIAERLQARGLATVASESLLDCFEQLAAAENAVQAQAAEILLGATPRAKSKNMSVKCASLSPSYMDASNIHSGSAASDQVLGLPPEAESHSSLISNRIDQPVLTERVGFRESGSHNNSRPQSHANAERCQHSSDREINVQREGKNSNEEAAGKGAPPRCEMVTSEGELWTDVQTCALAGPRITRSSEGAPISPGACSEKDATFLAKQKPTAYRNLLAQKRDGCCGAARGVESSSSAGGAASARQREEKDSIRKKTLLRRREEELRVLQQKLVHLLLSQIRTAVESKGYARSVEFGEKQTFEASSSCSCLRQGVFYADGINFRSACAEGERKTQTLAAWSKPSTVHSRTSSRSGPRQPCQRSSDRAQRPASQEKVAPSTCSYVASAEGIRERIVQEDGGRVAAWAILALLRQQQQGGAEAS